LPRISQPANWKTNKPFEWSELIKAVLFDLDGLMVDSEPHALATWHEVMARRGVRLDQATIDAMLGQRQIETARMLVERLGLPDDPHALGQEKSDLQIARLDGNVTAMPGLFALLDALDARGLKRAIASSGMRRYVLAVLRSIDCADRFEIVVTGEDVINGKPAPDVFLRAAERLSVDAAACVVLEDAPNGVAAAKAAGMTCIAVPNDFTRSLDLSAADIILPSLFGVRDALDLLLSR
jgi:HAD superfamily hydrolase (TIGR01509 family)